MARLIAAGCSYTYGHGLPDCHTPPDHPGPNPSKFAWPHLLGELTNRDVINLAVCGGSNKQIVYNLDNFEFKENDVCLIQWTFLNRTVFFRNSYEAEKIGPWSDTKFAKIYYAEQTDFFYDHIVNLRFLYNYINYKLASKGIKVINFKPFIGSGEPGIEDIILEKELNVDFVYDENSIGIAKCIDKANDDKHPGIKTQKVFSRYVLRKYPWLKE